jgi:hypothetical protein
VKRRLPRPLVGVALTLWVVFFALFTWLPVMTGRWLFAVVPGAILFFGMRRLFAIWGKWAVVPPILAIAWLTYIHLRATQH